MSARTGSFRLAWALVSLRTVAAFASVWLVAMSVLAQSDLSLHVSLDKDTIALDEQAVLLVEVSGSSQNLPQPQMPSLPMFEVYSQGRSSSLSISNGVVSSSVAYRYLIMPQKQGVYPIEGISVSDGTRTITSNKLSLTVLNEKAPATERLEDRAVDRQGESRDYFLEAVVDRRTPYINEQVTLTLRFYTAVQFYGSPELEEPATTGFWTEVLGNKPPYFQRLHNRQYKVIERSYALFPTQVGELTIGRAAISAMFATAPSRTRDPFDLFGDFFGRGQEATVRSNQLTIKVKPLPDQGKPDNFTGSIGNFNISATASKGQVEVNQPITVTIRISGEGNVKSIAEPIIPESPDFRTYRGSSSETMSKLNDRLGGTKVFEQVFIPRVPGALSIPALSFNYFDPGKNKYVSVSTQPIPINVIKPEGYVASPDVPYGGPQHVVGADARDIRYIKLDLGELKNGDELLLTRPFFVALHAVPVAILAGMVLVRRRREHLASNVGATRSRAASRMARRRLAKARSLASVDTANAFYMEVSAAVTSYIADKMNISAYGLTSDSISRLLEERHADPTHIKSVLELLHDCDFGRFSSASATPERLETTLRRAEDVMVRMEEVRFA